MMTIPGALTLEITAWGTVRASRTEATAMRKSLPAWVPDDTPGHFLKHADEQTVAAVAAVDQAISRGRLDLSDLRKRIIIAAPRYVGRIGGAASLERYGRGGGPALSPHLIPQHSLHSISGALSILLASRQPNFGVGGGDDSMVEGFLAALCAPRSDESSGVLLVATAWMPEPVLDRQANCLNEPVCYAMALAMQPAAGSGSLGTLQLQLSIAGSPAAGSERAASLLSVPRLCGCLDSLDSGFGRGVFSWTVPGGGTIVLHVDAAAGRLAAA
jgi:hypothetical protein